MTSLKLYPNIANSCYMDSVLSILFFSNMGFFISKILKQRVTVVNYHPGTCKQDSIVTDVKKYASEVQELLNKMFFDTDRKIHSNELIKKFAECNTDFGIGKFQNVAVAYTLFCDLFPNLMISFRRAEKDKIYIREQCLFDMTDLPDVAINVVSDPQFLVFSNGGIERLTKGLINWEERGFGFNILNDKYTLMGVILHIGLNHYSSVFRVDDNEDMWYYYDDIKGVNATQIEKEHVKTVFHDHPRVQPAMYFYIHKSYVVK